MRSKHSQTFVLDVERIIRYSMLNHITQFTFRKGLLEMLAFCVDHCVFGTLLFEKLQISKVHTMKDTRPIVMEIIAFEEGSLIAFRYLMYVNDI